MASPRRCGEFAGRLHNPSERDGVRTIQAVQNLVPDAYDCILSKLERASPKDRDDADYLFRSQKLDAQVLRDRYKNELGHNLIGKIEWHDQTLELWIDIFTAPR